LTAVVVAEQVDVVDEGEVLVDVEDAAGVVGVDGELVPALAG